MTLNETRKRNLGRQIPSHAIWATVVLWTGCAATGPARVQPTSQDGASLSRQSGPRQTTTGAHLSHPTRQPALAGMTRLQRQGIDPGAGAMASAGQRPVEKSGRQGDEALVVGQVLEAKTRKPIAGAMVLYGSCGTIRTATDAQGRYQLFVPWGAVYLHIRHRTHAGAEARFKTPRGGKVTQDFLLSKKPGTAPKEETIEGLVADQVFAPGTRSESHRIVLRISGKPSKVVTLFDLSGCSSPLKKWVGKHVRIRGYRGIGTVGWVHRSTPGFFVESLSAIQP